MFKSTVKSEFKLLAKVFATYLPPEYPYDVVGGQKNIKVADFDDRVDVLPVADPNIFSMSQRISLAQTGLQLAMASPQIHNLYNAYRKMYEALGIKDIDRILPPPPPNQPKDIPPPPSTKPVTVPKDPRERLRELLEASGFLAERPSAPGVHTPAEGPTIQPNDGRSPWIEVKGSGPGKYEPKPTDKFLYLWQDFMKPESRREQRKLWPDLVKLHPIFQGAHSPVHPRALEFSCSFLSSYAHSSQRKESLLKPFQ